MFCALDVTPRVGPLRIDTLSPAQLENTEPALRLLLSLGIVGRFNAALVGDTEYLIDLQTNARMLKHVAMTTA
jgi:hypothetical protein